VDSHASPAPTGASVWSVIEHKQVSESKAFFPFLHDNGVKGTEKYLFIFRLQEDGSFALFTENHYT
jgi:hypothetical protein